MGGSGGWRFEAQASAALSLVTSIPIDIAQATDTDAPAINRIYTGYIVESHVSFDTEPWSDEQRSAWLADRLEHGFPILVARHLGRVVGVAWAGPWRDKKAYATSVETTIVLDAEATGSGVGSILYGHLIDQLTGLGVHRCYAVVALPNVVSVALHQRLGFVRVGVLDEAGFKDGAFVSTLLLELRL